MFDYIGHIHIHFTYPIAPDPPTGLIAIQVSATSVMVSWTPPANTTIVTGYQIFYTENGVSEQSRDVSDASTDMDTIPGLKIASTYFITMVATSDYLPSKVVRPAKIIELGMK